MTKFCVAASQEHAAALLAHKQEMQQLSSAQRESLDSLNRQHMSALQRRDAQIQSLTEQHQAQLDALNRHVFCPLASNNVPFKHAILISFETANRLRITPGRILASVGGERYRY